MTREEAIYELRNAFKYNVDDSFMVACDMAIEALQADTVATIQTAQTYGKSAYIKELAEVVRCKDCRYAQDDVFHLFCELKSHKVMMEDYCSYGERREHGQD